MVISGKTEHGSEALYEFLNILGDKIVLNGWNKFRGGLDVKSLVFMTKITILIIIYCGFIISMIIMILIIIRHGDDFKMIIIT
jgi:hypothetical protein